MYGMGTVARLAEVGQLLGDDVTVEQLPGILGLRQAEAGGRRTGTAAGRRQRFLRSLRR